MPELTLCDLCGCGIPPHCHYVVRIDVFADPSLPAVSGEQINNMDFDAEMAKLMKEMADMSAAELQDQVFRRFEYRLCRACHARFLADPLGTSRARNRSLRVCDPPEMS